jgi:hypothetical protein
MPVCRQATVSDLPAICRLGKEVNATHHAAAPDIFAGGPERADRGRGALGAEHRSADGHDLPRRGRRRGGRLRRHPGGSDVHGGYIHSTTEAPIPSLFCRTL